VISPPIVPQRIGGRSYILLDMAKAGAFQTVARPGLTGLWGTSVPLDPRLLTSYVRDVSLVSPAAYAKIERPSAIAAFPHALGDSGLEYSGIFEDGWVGSEAYAVLAGGPPTRLIVDAQVLSAGQRLTVLVNGRVRARRATAPGADRLTIAIPATTKPRRIDLRWSGATRLAPPDGRTVAARLVFLGVEQARPSLLAPRDLSLPGIVTSGVFADGWLGRTARFDLGGGPATLLRITGTVPADRHLSVYVDGVLRASRQLRAGSFAVRTGVPAASGLRHVRLVWGSSSRLAPNDPRVVSALLRFAGVG
jgi:hypothetical protein